MNDALADLPGPIKEVAYGIGTLIAFLKDGDAALDGAYLKQSKLGEILVAVAKIVQATVGVIKQHWPEISAVMGFVFDYVKTRIEGFIQLVGAIVEIVTSTVALVKAIFRGDWATAWQEMKDIAGAIINGFIGYVKSVFGNLPGILYGLGKDAGASLLKGIKDAATGSINVAGVNINPLSLLGRSSGGPVMAGNPYIVGERGPELFVPRQSGTVVPNHAMSGGEVTVNINGPVFARDEADARRAAGDIGFALRLQGVGLAV
jgi:hypothetical protein